VRRPLSGSTAYKARWGQDEVTGGLTNRNTKLVHTISYFGGKALCPKQRDAYNYTIQPLIAL
jgi:hypothetical protein